MTKREAAIVQLYTDCVMLVSDDLKYVYELAKEVMGKPVHTHELTSDIVREKVKPLFIELCENLAEGE